MLFFARLKEERKRLRLTQAELAGAGNVTPKSQGIYESGKVSPNAEYLGMIAKMGVDVQYLLTGVRSDVALAPHEKILLSLYREVPQPLQRAVLAALASGESSIGDNQSVTVGGNNTGAIARDNLVINAASQKKARKP